MVSKGFMAALLAAVIAVEAQAASDVVVEGVNMPAWVKRGAATRPLAAGASLQPADEIITAAGSRVLLRLGDGSQVKLGESARFVVAAAGRDPADAGLFRATLQVLAGAFRFTTSVVAKGLGRREVRIQLPGATAGIRGTDLWGKALPDRDFVVLIEGRIGVQRGDAPEVTMDRPLSVFDAPKDLPTPALGTVTLPELTRYAAETEIAAGTGATRTGGKWKLVAGSFDDQPAALALYDRLRAAGYAATIRPGAAGGSGAYRVRIGGLPSRGEALALGERLRADFGLAAPEVAR